MPSRWPLALLAAALAAPIVPAQAPPEPFKFDIVSIRPTKPDNQSGPAGGSLHVTADGLQVSDMSLSRMLSVAYQQQLTPVGERLLGLPDWAKTEAFDVQAKVADSDIAEWSKLSQSARRQDQARWELSLLFLLTEQFKLKTHSETRDEPIYALVVAKGGPKLKPSTSDGPQSLKMMGPGRLAFSNAPIEEIASMCANMVGRKVVDKTGLTGKYDYTLDWTAYEGPEAAASGSEPDASQPPVFTVVQEQLGLKLEPQKGPVEYIVVDHAEKPEPMDGAGMQGAPPNREPALQAGDARQELQGVYKTWLNEDVRWVITPEEAEAFKRLTNDEERDRFIESFWQRRNPTPDSPRNAYRDEIYARIAYANKHFASGQPGWSTDRGHVYIVYGSPNGIVIQPSDGSVTWHYRHLPGMRGEVWLKFAKGYGENEYRLVGPWPGAGAETQTPDPPTPNPLRRRLSNSARISKAQGAGTQAESKAAGVPTFDVVSVRPSSPEATSARAGFTPDGYSSEGMPLQAVIAMAYRMSNATDDHYAGIPDWAKTQGWDIQAKVDAADIAVWQALPNLQKEVALQALLAVRFKLSAHKEPKEFPGYALVIAKNGPKLAEAKPGDAYSNGLKKNDGSAEGAGDCHTGRNAIKCQAMSMNVLAQLLSQDTGRTVEDKTGLSRNYDFVLQWTPDAAPNMTPYADGNASSPDAPAPSIFTALQEQLGLRLDSEKVLLDSIVIDHVERPAPN